MYWVAPSDNRTFFLITNQIIRELIYDECGSALALRSSRFLNQGFEGDGRAWHHRTRFDILTPSEEPDSKSQEPPPSSIS